MYIVYFSTVVIEGLDIVFRESYNSCRTILIGKNLNSKKEISSDNLNGLLPIVIFNLFGEIVFVCTYLFPMIHSLAFYITSLENNCSSISIYFTCLLTYRLIHKNSNHTKSVFVTLWIFLDNIIVWAPSLLHFKGLGMRNLQYEMRISQKSYNKVTKTVYVWFDFLWIRR